MKKKPLVLITGGSSGLGKCLASEFLVLKKEICLIARNGNTLQMVKEELENLYPSSKILVMNGSVADEKFVEYIYEMLDSKDYYPEFLINCAGIGRFGKAEIVSERMINSVFEGNLVGLILMCGKALRYMINEECYIINIMSTAALRGKENETVYCAAKWGARGYTEALKNTVKNTKIHVIGVFPGGMNTNFWKNEENNKKIIQNYMSPNDVAKKIIYELIYKENKNVGNIIIERK